MASLLIGYIPSGNNAYAKALANEIVLPAVILQAPFFNPAVTDAENYGGIDGSGIDLV